MWRINYLINHLVSRHRGTLPLILTCPHDGDTQPPEVSARTGQELPGGCDFETDRDLKARAITIELAQRLLDICGEAPYVVLADFNRDYIDANRVAADSTPNCAYEVSNAKPFYDEYHNTIRDFVAEIRAETGGLGLLFDLHGTAGVANAPAQIYLGTDTRHSIARLLSVDPQAMSRRRSLFSFLTAASYSVLPTPPDLAVPSLDGGYTIKTYGSNHADGLDAIQIEIVKALRTNIQERTRLVETLAYAMINLIQQYADTHTLAMFKHMNLVGIA